MDKRQKETVELNINGKNAAKELERLTKRANDLRDAMAKAAKEKGIDSRQYKTLQREFNSVQNEMRKMQKSMVEVNQVLSHLDTATPDQLNRTMRELNKQLNSPNIQRGSEEWKRYQEQLKAVKAEMSKIREESGEAKSWVDNLNDGLSKWGNVIAGVTAAAAGVYMALSSFRDKASDKEESQANLKALTGLDDDTIAWLTVQAEKLSTSMASAGLRIRQSSKEIINAYMLVGSNKPELLNDAEALNMVTIEALRLANAAQIEVKKAVDAVTTSLNQYGESADKAARYVNVLAAGSKAGAADVSAINAVVLRSGVAANMANMSIEQLVGTTETLAESGLKGERAGTGLKTFLLKLESGANDTKPSVVGLATALDNLAKQNLTTAEITKRFGLSAVNVADTLIKSRDKIASYTEAVTATKIAEEQAAIVSDTAAAKRAQMSNEMNELGIQLLNDLDPAIMSITGKITNWTRALVQFVEWANKHRATITTLIVAITAYTVALNAQNIAQKLVELWNGKLMTSFKNLNKTLMKNPWTLLAVGIATAIAYIKDYIDNQEKLTELQEREAEASQRITEKYNAQTNQVRILREALDKENVSREKKIENIEKLKNIIPGYTAELDNEGRLTKENKAALDQYNKSIEDRIALEVYEDQLKELKIKKDKAEEELEKKRARRQELDKKGSRAWLTRMREGINDSDLKKVEDEINQLDKAYQKILDKVNAINNIQPATTVIEEDNGDGGGSGAESKAALAIQRLETQYAKERKEQSKLLADKKISQQEYDDWEYNAQLALFEKKQKLYSKDSREWLRLEEQKEELETKHLLASAKAEANDAKSAKDKLNAELKLLDKQEKRDKLKAKGDIEAAALNGQNREIAEMEYQQKLFEIEQKILDEKMKLYNQDSEEYNALLVEKEEAAQSYALRVQSVAAGMLTKYITYDKNAFEKEYEFAKQLNDQKILLDSNYNAIKKAIADKEASSWLKAYNEDIKNYKASISKKQEALQNDYRQGLITEEGYNAAIQKLHVQTIDLMKQRTQQVLQQISSFISSIGNLMSARYDEEIARIEKRYDTEIKYAEKAGKDTTAIEAAKDAEVNALRKKQAQQQEKIDIAQALLNTAMSISQTLATYGTTPWGLAMAAIAAAMGAVQVATIREQAQAKIAGYYEGGYTGGKKYRREAGVVHEGEFVANHQAVENPNVRPVLDFIDQAQRRNTVASITSNDLALAAAHQSGYLQGGYTSQTPVINVAPAPVSVTNQQELIDVIRVLNAQLADGIAAEVSVTGRRGIKNQEEKYNKLLNNKTRV